MSIDIGAAVDFDEVRIQTHTPGRRVVKVVNAVRPWPPFNNRHPRIPDREFLNDSPPTAETQRNCNVNLDDLAAVLQT
jgi:hypothetical protein